MTVDGDPVVTDRKLAESSHQHVFEVAFRPVEPAGCPF